MRPVRPPMLGLICVMLILTLSSPATASSTKKLTQMQWREKVIAQLQLFSEIGSRIYKGERQLKSGEIGQGCNGITENLLPGLSEQIAVSAPNSSLLGLYGTWLNDTVSLGLDCLAFEPEPKSRMSKEQRDLVKVSTDLQKARVAGNRLWRSVVK